MPFLFYNYDICPPFSGIDSRYTVKECAYHCPNCTSAPPLRGCILDFQTCIEVRHFTTCPYCKTKLKAQVRMYTDGRVMQNTKKGWIQINKKVKNKGICGKILQRLKKALQLI